MKAYRIRRISFGCQLTADCRNQLPSIDCPGCGRVWQEGLIEFPTINFPFLTEKRFLARKVVSVEEFEKIRKRIITQLGRDVLIVPGSSFGPLEGQAATTKLDDFVWGTICIPQISRRARDILASEGIELLTAECSIRYGRRQLDSHLALQVEPVAMLTKASCERARITYCPTCGDFFQNYPKPEMDGDFQLVRSAWPKGMQLVQLRETLDVIPSEEFMAAVQKHRLTGIRFEEYGEFVSAGPLGNTMRGNRKEDRESETDESSLITLTRTWLGKLASSGGRDGQGRNLILRNLIVNPDEDKVEDAAEEPPPAAATEIARLLGGKVRQNRRHVINLALDEPAYAFEIPLDDKRFKARVCLSETAFSFETKYRRGERAFLEEALFCVSFNVPDAIMYTKNRVESVSKALGVAVYRQGFVEDEVVEKYLLSKPVRDCLAKIDFKPLSRLFLNPIQLEASSKLSTPEACAAQVRVFMDLMNALACARKPEAVKKEKAKTAVRKRGAKGRPR